MSEWQASTHASEALFDPECLCDYCVATKATRWREARRRIATLPRFDPCLYGDTPTNDSEARYVLVSEVMDILLGEDAPPAVTGEATKEQR
jgi:hypothetical protein